ncbi:MAG: FtsP/CotA-like multicopper oxidase with cupredoxin domain [Parasphingorhabdus sp.]|jgi:FtsP/CotA-like multicopper oxidase with cupredoxin domain
MHCAWVRPKYNMVLGRRQFLQAASLGGSGLLAPGFHQLVAAAEMASSFQNSLALPPLEEGHLIDGARQIDLSLQYGVSNFFGDRPTPAVGINGNYLGPVLRVQQGDDVMFKVTNRLSEPSTLHWHGLNLPAAMDGGPHQVIDSGKTWTSAFKIRQGASTQWYHMRVTTDTQIGLCIPYCDPVHTLSLPTVKWFAELKAWHCHNLSHTSNKGPGR